MRCYNCGQEWGETNPMEHHSCQIGAAPETAVRLLFDVLERLERIEKALYTIYVRQGVSSQYIGEYGKGSEP